MNKTKTLKRPKSKKRIRISKKRKARRFKTILKKSKFSGLSLPKHDPDFLDGITKTPSGLRDYIPKYPVDAYSHSLQKYNWEGLLTLKLHSPSYSKNDQRGRKNRFDFINLVMENLCNRTFRVNENQLIWVACDEFGISGVGHVHVLFSFDSLRTNGREEKIPKTDYFSENGDFWEELRESVKFFWKKLSNNPSAVDLHWRPMWKNEGLVNYFCKLEFGEEEKHFKFSKYWEIHEGLIAA